MRKLFVAVDLPTAVTAELARIQLRPMPGLRSAEPSQMHLTLHYIGEADVERMAAALRTVVVPLFPLVIARVGQFPSADGAVTLWAGVRESAELLELHAAVPTALASEGFRPETRRYNPHITLARCGPEVPTGVVHEFLTQNEKFSLPAVPVVGFGLYSSAFIGDVPVYKREQSYTLRVAATAE